jgi:hypothetical protein
VSASPENEPGGLAPAGEGDSGEIETLPDGSVSIPVLEEELVVTKRVVVRERIVVHKDVATRVERVEDELRRERVELEDDEPKGREGMQIDKHHIVALLRERGDHAKATEADQELPEKVDHEQHGDLLSRFGIDPHQLGGGIG